jgi:hypothetical protein
MKKVILIIVNLFGVFKSLFTNKKRHWYIVKFEYRYRPHGDIIFSYTWEIGFRNQCDVMNRRLIKTTIKPIYYKSGIKRSLLNNGYFDCEPICYLGYFKK